MALQSPPRPAVMEAITTAPDPALRPYLSAYHGYRQTGGLPAIHRGLPSPFLTLIFTLDEPLELVEHVDPRQAPSSYTALAGGLHTSPALIAHHGAQSGIQLMLDPLGARAVLGLPSGELSGQDFDAEEVIGPIAREIQSRLAESHSWSTRFRAIDLVLRRQLREAPAPHPAVAYAWNKLLTTSGRVSISELAGRTGWSQKHLANLFRTEIGITPKSAARVIRFDRARRMMLSRSASEIGLVAAECGYFDHSHMVRDFQALAGCSPTTYVCEERSAGEFQNVQADEAAGESESTP